MDPKQTAPQGGQPGGQEGQNGQAQSTGANPVFGAAGNLGGNTLSTGANVSQTMDSLNSGNSFASGKSLLQRKRVDNVDPVTGDIIISSSPNDKPAGGSKPINKALLIKIGGVILVLGAIALVVGIVMAFVSGGDKKSNNGSGNASVSTISADAAFNSFANYILSGDESSDPVSTYISIADAYTINTMLEDTNSEESKEFFNIAKQKFDVFTTSFNNSNLKNESSFLNSYVPSYTIIFNFVYNYSQIGVIDLNTLAAIYSEEGADGIDQFFDDNFGVFNDRNDTDMSDYYNYEKKIFDYTKQYLEKANEASCIKNNKISDNCRVSMSESDTSAYNNAVSSAERKVNLVVDKLISGTAQINTEIKNPGSIESEENVVVEEGGIKPEDIIIDGIKGDS